MKRVGFTPAGVSLDQRTGLGRRRVVRKPRANEVVVGREDDFEVGVVDRAIEGEIGGGGLGHALVREDRA